MSKFGYTGFKGERVGEALALSLKRYPAEIVVVHHIWNYRDSAILQIERRDSNHENCTFERIKL